MTGRLWLPKSPAIIRERTIERHLCDMLLVNQLNGFGVGGSSLTYADPVAQGLGTIIGDFTSNSSLFNGNTTTGSSKASTNAYIGKTFVAPIVLEKMTIYPDSGFGFANDESGNITVTLYGKNGTPANGTDGTSLGSTSFADQTTSKVFTSTDQVNSYTSVWAYISNGSATSIRIFEVYISGWM